MELLTAILTALFFWIFIYYCLTDGFRQARKKAGRQLLVLKQGKAMVAFVFVLAVGALCMLGVVVSSPGQPGLNFVTPFMTLVNSALLAAVFLMKTEFREHGIIRTGIRNNLIPWHKVEFCRWTSNERAINVQCFHRPLEQYPIDPGQIVEATAILLKYVEVRDATGPIFEEDLRPLRKNADGPESHLPLSDEPARLGPPRFQFSIMSLLLLVLAASAAFSWFGIRYRRDQRQADALEQLDEFSAVSTSRGFLQLDFSKCRKKPTDADLVPLADIYRLHHLDLSGCPITDETLVHLDRLYRLYSLRLSSTRITDAGLKHLHTLRNLHYIALFDTAVTDAGVAELQRALPDATIVFE